MADSAKTIDVKVVRTISAAPGEVFDAWLNPQVKGTPWQMNDRLIFDPKVDGLWYWLIQGTAHYGRFIKLDRAQTIEHTWVSPHTLGRESVVTVTFLKEGKGTVMTLIHSGLPNDEGGRGHEGGWNSFLDVFPLHFELNQAKGGNK